MQVIEIRDQHKDGYLAFDLKDVLQCIDVVGNLMYWTIYSIEATCSTSQPHCEILVDGIASIEQEAASSPTGLRLGWGELCTLARDLEQTQNALIVGSIHSTPVRRAAIEELCKTCDVIIDAIDTTFWRVYSSRKEVIDTLQKTFRSVTVETLE